MIKQEIAIVDGEEARINPDPIRNQISLMVMKSVNLLRSDLITLLKNNCDSHTPDSNELRPINIVSTIVGNIFMGIAPIGALIAESFDEKQELLRQFADSCRENIEKCLSDKETLKKFL